MDKETDIILLADVTKYLLTIMPVGDVPKVMTQSHCLNKVFVEAQTTTYGAGNFRNILYMENPTGNMIIFEERKDLGFVNVTGIGRGMHNLIGIMEKHGAVGWVIGAPVFFSMTANAISAECCVCGKRIELSLVIIVFYLLKDLFSCHVVALYVGIR